MIRVRQRKPTLGHHLDEITKTEFVPQIPAHAEHDDLPVEMAAFEKIINVQHARPGSSRANLSPNMRHTHASHQNPRDNAPSCDRRSGMKYAARTGAIAVGAPSAVLVCQSARADYYAFANSQDFGASVDYGYATLSLLVGKTWIDINTGGFQGWIMPASPCQPAHRPKVRQGGHPPKGKASHSPFWRGQRESKLSFRGRTPRTPGATPPGNVRLPRVHAHLRSDLSEPALHNPALDRNRYDGPTSHAVLG